jgi:hypothetical protein
VFEVVVFNGLLDDDAALLDEVVTAIELEEAGLTLEDEDGLTLEEVLVVGTLEEVLVFIEEEVDCWELEDAGLADEEAAVALLDEVAAGFFNSPGVAASMKTVIRRREMRMI